MFFFFFTFLTLLYSSLQANTLLLKETDEKLAEAGKKATRTRAEAALLGAEVQRLQKEKKEEVEAARTEQLSRHVGQMSRELDELRAEHGMAG